MKTKTGRKRESEKGELLLLSSYPHHITFFPAELSLRRTRYVQTCIKWTSIKLSLNKVPKIVFLTCNTDLY